MLAEALIVLASAAGAAVAQAAGTDAWVGVRERVARIFGRGDASAAQVALVRLDRTAAALDAAEPEQADQLRARLDASWQARFEDLLESLNEADRVVVAGQLQELVTLRSGAVGGASARDGGLTAGGDVDIRAEGGSVAGGVIHGGIRMENPSQPGPVQG
ncbi:hypothetical protein RM704_39325 [Streptomyces sp. DSM 3412]|uniref:Uncharacterized protein n=1 Tax=Streptomyces gottesmaniae TaxID=3075518 RepID=A0ABU2ZA01_9ACTN|nr:hypothetical protein [Streptomyces sp. DSM 3412]MDT0573428.1 hypothetical protein [Streptomyces sp. DSM 3412]